MSRTDARPGAVARLARATAAHPVVTLVTWALLLATALGTAVFGITGQTLFERLDGAR